MMIATITTYADDRKKADMTDTNVTNAERAGQRWHAEDIASGLHRCGPTCPLYKDTPTTTVASDSTATPVGNVT